MLIWAGNLPGLRHLGMFAMNSRRIQKGHRHFGHDIGEDDAPCEAGPDLIDDEPIWKDGSIVGRMRSGDWSFRLEWMV